MTYDEAIALARKHALPVGAAWGWAYQEHVIAAILEAAVVEREECAKLCDAAANYYLPPVYVPELRASKATAEKLAELIRARSSPPPTGAGR